MSLNAISGEKQSTMFVVVCPTETDAKSVVTTIEQHGIDTTQYDLVSPNEKNYAFKLEPEAKGIARTAVKAHVVFGFIGLVVGLGIWGILYMSHIAIVQSSPWLTLIPALFFGAAFGMMLGGLVTLRPDHQLTIQTVKNARKNGHWSLVVHTRSEEQSEKLMQEFSKADIHFVRTL